MVFLKYLTANPNILANGKIEDEVIPLWTELTSELNSVGSGPVKNAREWQSTFRKWRHTVRAKELALKQQTKKPTTEAGAKCKGLTYIEELALSLWRSQADDSPRSSDIKPVS